ncbi:MAG TPA: hypothetical protein VII78_07210, partial [Myxococcota bacterium]
MTSGRRREWSRWTVAFAAVIALHSSCALPARAPDDFTDADLAVVLRDQRCGLITVVSPGMPLSIENLPNVSKIAAEHRLALTVLLDPRAGSEREKREVRALVPDGSEPRRNASRSLGLHGSLLHYPTLHVFIDGELAPEVIYGAKSIESYESLLSQIALRAISPSDASGSRDRGMDAGCSGIARLAQGAEGQPREGRAGAPDGRSDSAFDPNALPVSAEWKETRRVAIGRRAKYYFKPLATGDWVAYQAGLSNHLLDLRSGSEVRLPGTVDPVPSPDEKLLTVPSVLASVGLGGLQFFRMDDLIAGRSGRAALVLTDHEIPGTYQSVGQRTENGKTVYRVVSESLILRKGFYFQDYESVEANGRVVELRPRTKSKRRLCPDVPFA